MKTDFYQSKVQVLEKIDVPCFTFRSTRGSYVGPGGQDCLLDCSPDSRSTHNAMERLRYSQYITTVCRMLHQGVLILYAGMRDTEEYEINAINRSYGKQFFFQGWVAHRTELLLW